MYVRYNNNTHTMLKVNASLESPMKGFILSHFDGHVAWGNIAF